MSRCRAISNCAPRGSRSGRRGDRGATLAELLVVLVIISILAVTTLPFAETAAQRRKELALRETLRDVRTAIDDFHADWKAEEISGEETVSENGYPLTLELLVDGVEDSEGDTRRYLRRLPRNPFGAGTTVEAQWRFLGYADPADTLVWNGEDVYDLRPVTDKIALDGTEISSW